MQSETTAYRLHKSRRQSCLLNLKENRTLYLVLMKDATVNCYGELMQRKKPRTSNYKFMRPFGALFQHCEVNEDQVKTCKFTFFTIFPFHSIAYFKKKWNTYPETELGGKLPGLKRAINIWRDCGLNPRCVFTK